MLINGGTEALEPVFILCFEINHCELSRSFLCKTTQPSHKLGSFSLLNHHWGKGVDISSPLTLYSDLGDVPPPHPPPPTPLQSTVNDAEWWTRCSRRNRQKETISMTQPALSGVSTVLGAHLLPAGHRQKKSGTERQRNKKPLALQILQPSPRTNAPVYAGKTLRRPEIN